MTAQRDQSAGTSVLNAPLGAILSALKDARDDADHRALAWFVFWTLSMTAILRVLPRIERKSLRPRGRRGTRPPRLAGEPSPYSLALCSPR